jgi:hypothetical protein
VSRDCQFQAEGTFIRAFLRCAPETRATQGSRWSSHPFMENHYWSRVISSPTTRDICIAQPVLSGNLMQADTGHPPINRQPTRTFLDEMRGLLRCEAAIFRRPQYCDQSATSGRQSDPKRPRQRGTANQTSSPFCARVCGSASQNTGIQHHPAPSIFQPCGGRDAFVDTVRHRVYSIFSKFTRLDKDMTGL